MIFKNTSIFAKSGLKFVAVFLLLRFLFSDKFCFTRLFLVWVNHILFVLKCFLFALILFYNYTYCVLVLFFVNFIQNHIYNFFYFVKDGCLFNLNFILMFILYVEVFITLNIYLNLFCLCLKITLFLNHYLLCNTFSIKCFTLIFLFLYFFLCLVKVFIYFCRYY